jgi:hypothetical protein
MYPSADEANFEPQEFAPYIEESDLRPPAIFRKSYRVLSPYERTTFAEVTLKKTRNGHKAKSGVVLERSISPKRISC